MSNGNLDSYIRNNKVEDVFLFTIIIRIIIGIEYLQKNQLIHRDLKPQNILIDHDYLPYISDSETVKSISEGKNTQNLGSPLYLSPEQYEGLDVSYPTDIYSFGLIEYFLFEKEDMFDISSDKKSIKQMTNGPSIIHYIYENCIKINSEQRIKCNEIKMILDYIFYFFEEHLMNEKDNINFTLIINCIFECKINLDRNKSLIFLYNEIQNRYDLFYSKIQNNLSLIFVNLGFLYEKDKQDYSKAIEYYEKSAKLNNSYALNNLGIYYRKGIGVTQDYSKAIKYYEKSAELNNSCALNNLGGLYAKGIGVKQDYSKAIEYYEKAAELNDSEALFNLGLHYEKGEGVKQDYSKAIKYYEKSADLNNSYTLNKLGLLYENGEGVKQDYSKAFEYYKKSAELNDPEAFNNLGTCYENGYGAKQDYSKAIEYYKKSAEFNNSCALFNLGLLYERGEGVKQDYPKAIEYYEKSAKLDYSPSLYKIGFFYKNGFYFKKNYLKAKEWFEKAADLSNSEALNGLADLYESGFGVEQNYEEALNYYKKSAALNNSHAFLRIGDFYLNGYGVNVNYSKAIQHYESSSYLNNSLAHFVLGDIYSNNDAIDSDFEKSIKYFQKSIGIQTGLITTCHYFNHPNGIMSTNYKTNNHRYISYNDIGLIYLIEMKELEKAIDNIKESAFAEYPFGQNNFGILNEFYLKEKGNAEYMYQRSSKHNFSIAEFNLGRMYELDNKTKESIDYYILASEHEDEPLVYHEITRDDKRLNISKKFIICLTNLKLFIHYFLKNNEDESKKYFNKAFNNLTLNTKDCIYQFKFKIKIQQEYSNDLFSYLKKFIFNFPLFNLINQPNIDIKSYSNIFEQNKDENVDQVETKGERKEPFIFKTDKQENKCENYFSSKIEIEKLSNQHSEKNEKENISYENKQQLLFNETNLIKQNKENKKYKKFSIITSEYIFGSDIYENKENCQTKNEVKNFNEQNYLLADQIIKINVQNIENSPKNKNEHYEQEKEFKNPSELFDFVISCSKSNSEIKQILIKEINSIIDIMNEILFTPPYPILFGRISIVKPKEKVESKQSAIDQSFYDGFWN